MTESENNIHAVIIIIIIYKHTLQSYFGPAQNEHPYGPNLRSLAPSGQWSARFTGPNLSAE